MKHVIHCPRCHQPLYRFTVGNVVDWSHNPNATGATQCQTPSPEK